MVVSLMRLAVTADPQQPTKWGRMNGNGTGGGRGEGRDGMRDEMTAANQGHAMDSHVADGDWNDRQYGESNLCCHWSGPKYVKAQ